MEEKKLDLNSIIGFVLIFGILLFWFYQNQPTPEEIEAQKAKIEQQKETEKATEKEVETPVLGNPAVRSSGFHYPRQL